MKVVGVGFGRTGTLSMKAALEQLGFAPCYHMADVLGDERRRDQWIRIAEGQQVPWDEVFAGYAATVDWPAAAYWRELVDAYPDAKVILTVRDPRRWWKSASETIFTTMAPPTTPALRLLQGTVNVFLPKLARFAAAMRTAIWERQLGLGTEMDGDRAIAAFENHTRAVQAYVPADRLLVFDVKQGWEPLCAFLDVSVPDAPFPHMNDTASFHEHRRATLLRPIKRVGAVAAGVAAVGVAVLVSRSRRR